MRGGPLELQGFAYYVDRVRRGERDPYAAYRIFERYWYVPGTRAEKLAVLQKAARLLLDHDPWLVAGHALSLAEAGLAVEEIERVASRLAKAVDGHAARYLQAKLWFYGAGGRGREGAPAALRKTVELLRTVPLRHRERDWWEILAECHERLGDWPAFTRVFPRLLATTEAEWRSPPLRQMLEFAVRRQQWRSYDRWRKEWDRLPAQRYSCECETNALGTLDGLRALGAGRWDEIPTHLASAGQVTAGCPHLNSYGFRLDLVQRLVKHRRHLGACRDYLERATHFGTPAGLLALRTKVARALGRSTRVKPRRSAKRSRTRRNRRAAGVS